MNVLLHVISQNGEGYEGLALIPSELLEDYDLDKINHKRRSEEESIADIFDRLGIDANDPLDHEEYLRIVNTTPPGKRPEFPEGVFKSNKDLEKYLNLTTPFTVDKVVFITNN